MSAIVDRILKDAPRSDLESPTSDLRPMNQSPSGAVQGKPPISDLPDDVVLSVRNVSKKFCRNLKRSMGYGIKDLACNLVVTGEVVSRT